MNMSGIRSRQFGRWISTLAVLVLLILTRSTLSWAVDLGNGFNLTSVIYFDFTQASGDHFDTGSSKNITDDQANKNIGLANGFHTTRIYVNLLKEVNDQLSFRITTDQMTIRADGNTEATPFGLSGFGGAGRSNLFIKFAYAQYKLSPALMIRAGLTQTPWIATEEERWGYRFLRPVFWDEQGALVASDMGVAAVGTFFDKLIGYHFMFSNGEGYQNTSPANSSDGRGYAGQGRIDLNVLPGLTLSAFGLKETVHNGLSGWNPTREVFFAMYAHPLFRIAAEYIMADDHGDNNPVSLPTTPNSASGSKGLNTGLGTSRFDQGRGYGGWAWVHIPGIESVGIFGRFYSIKPNTATDAGKMTEANAGISYEVLKELIVAIDDTIISQKLLNLSDGSIETFRDNIIGARAQFSF